MKIPSVRERTRLTILLLGLALTAWTAPARATWSIIAVDRETGQVGMAGASCTYLVDGIAAAVPGVGVVVVQAMSNEQARDRGVELMRGGATPEEIVKAMRDPQFDPEHQQYAVVVLDAEPPPVTYSGKEIDEWRGTATGDGVAVQGNILVDETVVARSLAAFDAAKSEKLAIRLMGALQAGAAAGGDRRCGDQRARSAFVTVYNREDPLGEPYLKLVVYDIDKGRDPAVARLAEEFERWKRHGAARKSTRRYVIP